MTTAVEAQRVDEQQEAEQRAAGIVRRHYHSTYPPSTIVFNKTDELLEVLATLEIPYRETETLVLAEMSDLAEKLPGLQQWLLNEKQAAEERLQKITSKRSKPTSTGKNSEHERSVGAQRINNYSLIHGGRYGIASRGYSGVITNCINAICINLEGASGIIAELSGESRRETTSIRINTKLLQMVYAALERHGISRKKFGRLVELLLIRFLQELEKAESEKVSPDPSGLKEKSGSEET